MSNRTLFALVSSIVFMMTCVATANAAQPQPPKTLLANQGAYADTDTLQFAMWSFDDLRDGVVSINVAVRSRTDMPVPNVFVYVSGCHGAQEYPLLLAGKVRHMDGQQETLRAFSQGRLWEWQPFSAPANTEPYLVLNLKFKIRQEGGPFFCLAGLAGTTYDHGHNVMVERKWK